MKQFQYKHKKTGEIVTVEDGKVIDLPWRFLNSDWEKYEKPKEYWYISAYGNLAETDVMTDLHKGAEEIGNLFDTKEEAEKVVEKLKAWRRLKDKGFEFRWIDMQTGQIKYSFFLKEGQKFTRGDEDDLLLLFGGEE